MTSGADVQIGVPASKVLPLAVASGVIAADVPCPANATTTVLTTTALSVGTWLLTFSGNITGTVAAAADLAVGVGTATATFAGPQMTTPYNSPAANPSPCGFSVIVTVTAAGTLTFKCTTTALSAVTFKQYGVNDTTTPVTGYVAVKIG